MKEKREENRNRNKRNMYKKTIFPPKQWIFLSILQWIPSLFPSLQGTQYFLRNVTAGDNARERARLEAALRPVDLEDSGSEAHPCLDAPREEKQRRLFE